MQLAKSWSRQRRCHQFFWPILVVAIIYLQYNPQQQQQSTTLFETGKSMTMLVVRTELGEIRLDFLPEAGKSLYWEYAFRECLVLFKGLKLLPLLFFVSPQNCRTHFQDCTIQSLRWNLLLSFGFCDSNGHPRDW